MLQTLGEHRGVVMMVGGAGENRTPVREAVDDRATTVPETSRDGWLPAGSGGLAPSASSFREVSGLSHRQRSFPPPTSTSVAGL